MGLDEKQYKDTYNNINERPCVFEKAILSTRCDCEYSRRIAIAEREAGACVSGPAWRDCATLLNCLRENARFALKLSQVTGPLPHSKEIKVQVGGGLGLQALLDPEQAEAATVANIRALVVEAQRRFGEIANLPYRDIVKHIGAYIHRRPHR